MIEELGNSDFFNTINYKKIDIHTDSAMAHDYHIYVVPTVVLLNKKKIIWRYAGVNAAAFYIENIKNISSYDDGLR